MDLAQDSVFAVAGAIFALIVQWVIRYVMERNPEVLGPGRLRALGLPHKGPDAKRFKRIFTKNKDKRVRIAEDEMKRSLYISKILCCDFQMWCLRAYQRQI